MEQENIGTAQPVPGPPLQQISQDRFNQLRSGGLQHSPSLPAYLHENVSPSRRDSDIAVAADVRSKIAFFSSQNHIHNGINGTTSTNSFAIAGSPTRSPIKSAFNSPTKSHSRANSVMSVSMPSDPSELRTLVQALQSSLEQSRNRERLVAERVESLMEQLQSSHSRSRHEAKENEREVKAMKKQVHRAELALIKCQAELGEAREGEQGWKARAGKESEKKDAARKEAFERARVLAGQVEDLEVVKRERDLLQSENKTLKTVQASVDATGVQAKNNVDMKNAGVQVELPKQEEKKDKAPEEQDYLCSRCTNNDLSEPEMFDSEIVEELQDELSWVKSQLKREQDLVHFMNMQCQFRTCPCRMAEAAGVRFVHDHVYDQQQQELAHMKGNKRKAQDELPLPQWVAFKKSKSGPSKQIMVSEERLQQPETPLQLDSPKLLPEEVIMPEIEQPDEPKERSETDDNTTLRAIPFRLPPQQVTESGVITLEEAADIPLPSPRNDDLEPTALLEDMTQVMVEPEPLAIAKHFTFSTSTSSRRAIDETPVLRQSHSTISVPTSDDLFDIRPPRHLPPRPSTVMGLRTVDVGSPIRMVPPSPDHRDSLTPSGSPRHKTMQVPLKDSPLRNAVTQRRSQSRPRGQSRARSPTPGRAVNPDSPSADTFFPVTPKQKAERQQRQIQTQPNSQLQALQPQPQTTTTRVPLRGLDEDDVFSPEKLPYYNPNPQHLNTEVLRGRQPLHENDPNTHASSMLPGTPITREAALAQIRARRDRARSVAMRKQSTDEESGRVKTPKSAARRGVLLHREGVGRDISNLSQASAPARF